jgi:hypothetical protein
VSDRPVALPPPAPPSYDEGRRAAVVTSLRWTGAMLGLLVGWLLVSVAVRPVAFLAPVVALTAVLFTVAAWRTAARGTRSGPVSAWAVIGVVLDVVVSTGVVVIVGWALLLLLALARS